MLKRILALGLLQGVVLLAVGCGASPCRLTGQVLYEGKPLPGGLITFRPVDSSKNSVTSELSEQGHFSALLPPGETDVLVDNRELAPPPPAPPLELPPGLPPEVLKKLQESKASAPPPEKKASARYIKIPERYHDIATSDLRFTIEGSEQTKEVRLTK